MNLAEKCRKVVEALSQKHGAFTLFVLFEHDVIPGKWDLLFSAHWLRPGRAAIKTIVDSLSPELTSTEWQSIANIVPLDPSMPYVQWIAQRYEAVDGVQEITNVVLDGVFVSRGYVIAARSGLADKRQTQKWADVQSDVASQIESEATAASAPRRRAGVAPAEKAA